MVAKRRGVLFWTNVSLLAAVGLFALIGLAGAPEALLLALAALAVLGFTAPAARWGAAGLLLTPGLLLVLGGAVALAAGNVGEALASELNEDNDGDGALNEDPSGDADGSRTNPSRVSGVEEARNHADDDSDGRVDEDPPTPPGARTAVAAASTVGYVLLAFGAVAIAAFLAFARRRERRAPKDAEPPPST